MTKTKRWEKARTRHKIRELREELAAAPDDFAAMGALGVLLAESECLDRGAVVAAFGLLEHIEDRSDWDARHWRAYGDAAHRLSAAPARASTSTRSCPRTTPCEVKLVERVVSLGARVHRRALTCALLRGSCARAARARNRRHDAAVLGGNPLRTQALAGEVQANPEGDVGRQHAQPPQVNATTTQMDLNDAEREREPSEDIDEVPSGVITADQVLAALRSVDVPHNEDRKNVKSDESALVRSLTLGALSRSHAPARVSAWARRRPRLARLLATYGCQQLPAGFPFASIQLNSDYASAMHCDRSNDGPSAIIALGDFQHGELWSYDRGVLPCKGEVKLFNGNQPHCTLPFKGERFSLIFFSSSGHDRMAPKEAMWLEALGFARLPTGTLSHSYRADEFASPHMEHPYTFGFHVTTEERCAYATKSLEAWREDWTPGVDDMAAACAARRKPGEVLGPDSVCPGLKLGYARLRSPTLRGDDRDGAGPSGTAESQVPPGTRGH